MRTNSCSFTIKPFAALAAVFWLSFISPPAAFGAEFRRGDANADGVMDISDGIATLDSLFLGGAAAPCAKAADADDSGALDITDPIFTFAFLFLGDREPPAPGPVLCGPDPTPDALGCAAYAPRNAALLCGGSRPSLLLISAPETVPFGGSVDVRFSYSDGDADIALLEMVSDPGRPSFLPATLAGIQGASGEASLTLRAEQLAFGKTTLFSLRLLDRKGLTSDAVDFPVTLVGAASGGSPPSFPSLEPARSVWSRPAGARDRLGPPLALSFADADGDLERLRIRIVVPGGEELVAEEPAARLRIAGVQGEVSLRPFLFRSSSALGKYEIQLTPIDRNGHVGATAAAEVELVEAGGAPPLAIAGVLPPTGSAGTEITIHGSGFDTARPERNSVEMSERSLEVIGVTETTLTAIVPDGAATSWIVVSNRLGQTVSDSPFVVPPSISITPDRADVRVGRSLMLEARVISAPGPLVEWMADGAVGGSPASGTITPEGLYTAPASPPPSGAVTITARLVAVTEVSASAQIAVLPPASWLGESPVIASIGGLVVSLDGRARVSIPPGALAGDVVVGVEALRPSDLPPPPAGARAVGAVELSPSGLVFAQPATVTIPLVRYLRPGTRLPLRFLSADGAYVDEGTSATVAESGAQATAGVAHFSTPVLLEPLVSGSSGPEVVVPVITSIAPLEAQEGLRIPVLVSGEHLDAMLDGVEVLTAAGEPTTDIKPGTIYPLGDSAGLLLAIAPILDLPEGEIRVYTLRFHRHFSTQPAEIQFSVRGLDELRVPLNETVAVSGSGAKRFSEVNVLGNLRVISNALEIESTGPVRVLGLIDARGLHGANATSWLGAGLGDGEGPELCGRGGAQDGRGGLGRERETLGEVAGETLEAVLGAIPLIGGGLSSIAHEILDSPDAEHDGAHAALCHGTDAVGCAPLRTLRGLGGRAGANIDLDEFRDETATLLKDCGDCIAAIVFGQIEGLASCAAIGSDVSTLVDSFDVASRGPTGRHGLGAAQTGSGGGGGGAGRFKTVGFALPEVIGVPGEFALALDGGGGGAGGGPGRSVRIVSASRIELMNPISMAELSLFEKFFRGMGPITGILDQIPRGRILADGGDGGNGSSDGRLTIVTNNVFAKAILDLIPWPTVGAFQGGGGGGGSGGRISLAAVGGVETSDSEEAQATAGGGLGGFGGETVVDPEDGTVGARQARSDLAKGSGGPVFIDDESGSYAFRTLSSDGQIETGNLVTNRNILRLRFRARSNVPVVVTIRSDAGAERSVSTFRNEATGVHFAEVVLFPGFSTLLAGHELLDHRILSVFADTDADGISDADEVSLLLDPANPDTDGDTYSDGDEILLGSNPRNADGDYDGVPDPAEFAAATSPTNADTDADGVRDGAEILLGTSPLNPESLPASIPEGKLLAATGRGFLSIVDRDSGATGALGRAAGGFGFGLAYGPLGQLLVASFTRLTTVNPLTQDALGNLAETEIGSFGSPDGKPMRVSQIAFHPGAGVLYAIELGPAPGFFETGQLVSISPATAAATRIGSPGPSPLHALAVDADGRLIASVEGDAATDRLVELDRSTGGILRDIGPIGVRRVYGLAHDAVGDLWASAIRADIEGQLLRIDQQTGAASYHADVDRTVFGLAFAPCPAPCGALLKEYPIAVNVTGLAVLDLTGDGRPEIVASHTGSLSILANHGDGSFADAVAGATLGFVVNEITAGDVNGDGRADVVAASELGSGPGIAVFLNSGAGTLEAPTQIVVALGLGYTYAPALGDVDGDSDLDIVTIARLLPSGATSVVTLLGGGDGTFVLGPSVSGLAFLSDFALGDIDGDGDLDFWLVEQVGFVRAFLGDGTGAFAQVPGNQFFTPAPTSIRLVDLDSDTKLDLLLTDTRFNGLVVARSNGAGGIATAALYPAVGSYPTLLAVGDLQRDGRIDVVTAGLESSAVSIFRGNGDGTVQAATAAPRPEGLVEGLELADLDGDGALDIVIVTEAQSGPKGIVGVMLRVR